MGGKRLKFPKRKKFVPTNKPVGGEENQGEKTVSSEEHEARLNLLKNIGLLK